MIQKYLHKISDKYASKWMILLADIVIIWITFFLAHIIYYNFRFDFDIALMLKQMPFVAGVASVCLILVNAHKGVVRFTGFKDIVNLIIGVNILATILILTSFTIRKVNEESLLNLSGSIIYIHLLLNILSLASFRLFVKSLYQWLLDESESISVAMIFGAGSSGMLTYDAINNDKRSNIELIGFIDDDERKVGKRINQLKVFSLKDINQKFIERHNLEQIIISIQAIDSYRLLQLTSALFALNLKVKIVPPVKNWIDGDLNVGQIKEFKIEDLLGREPIFIDNPALVNEYDNKIILITGAAGSIGSEIVRKLTNYNFKQLILVDNAESPLYNLQQELKRNNITNIVYIIADVRSRQRIDDIFNKYKPKFVFHAAAYKHVPLMENHPFEAVSVNINGTKNVADISVKHGVEKFTLISTDKAVNPANVMGATKRIAELYVNCLKASGGNTKFVTTRFGNVLGSNGSVIPLFKKQIEEGGPITVTHKEIVRYFMTIPEACQLVLEASAMGNGGEIFVFDMGESIKIFDLAKNMIVLSGLRYPEDINIKITGLRPGEKIFEELLSNGENTKPTYHDKIMIAKAKKLDEKFIESQVNLLYANAHRKNALSLVSVIKNLVPEFISNNSKFNILDNKTNA